ncbi:MAG: HD domain-containing protein [Fulvimarina manganoxydans]|uniref:HD domain-containing protein n=1 Tax=Fulvimarina manganoxydans TaxID=937218 RepID=UPI002355E560|nr:HD domain-containing protein [Fulvimarina manganoxydans]MCK5930623.1 HD domain-containing protein [Fulvimarina manganoxydans]
MTEPEIIATLDFLRRAEALKDTLRSGHTSTGRPESTAEHTWRLMLMALVFSKSFGEIDMLRLLKILVVHDLGEAISGDVPAIDQSPDDGRAARERADLQILTAPLPEPMRDEILGLWDDYDSAGSREAVIAKGLDKLETILQHNQGANPPDFDYGFNLSYGRSRTDADPLLARIRAILDAETRKREAASKA